MLLLLAVIGLIRAAVTVVAIIPIAVVTVVAVIPVAAVTVVPVTVIVPPRLLRTLLLLNALHLLPGTDLRLNHCVLLVLRRALLTPFCLTLLVLLPDSLLLNLTLLFLPLPGFLLLILSPLLSLTLLLSSGVTLLLSLCVTLLLLNLDGTLLALLPGLRRAIVLLTLLGLSRTSFLSILLARLRLLLLRFVLPFIVITAPSLSVRIGT